MKKIIFALAAAMAFSTAAHAGPAEDKAAAELMEAMNVRATMSTGLQQTSQALPQLIRNNAQAALRNSKLTDEQRKAEMDKIEQQLPAVTAALQKELNDPKLIDEMYAQVAPLYARNFTTEEMKALAAFYRTPAGKKAAQVMPRLTLESMQLGQKVVQPRLQRVMEQFKQKK